MKMKALPMVLAMAATLMMSIPAIAAPSVTEYTEDGTASVDVIATVASSYSVALPADFSLTNTSGTAFEGTYEVGVKGNIASDKKVVCSPESTFTMTSGSNSATATVTQEKQTWLNTVTDGDKQIEIDSGTYKNAEGSVSVDLPIAGSYQGQLSFTFSLEDKD